MITLNNKPQVIKNKKILIPLLIIFAFLLLTPSFVLAAGSCLCIKKYEPGKTYCVTPQNIKATAISDLICQNPIKFGIENYLSATIQSCDYYANEDCTGSQQYTPPAPVQKETPFTPIVPKLQINIPTVQFSNITKEGQMLGIPFLAEYISGVYKYAVAIVSIIAIVMIMVGGLRWMTAGGNASAITGAKEMISGAVIGLILLLGSYTVLYTINPDLVSFKALQIEYIKPESLVIDLTDEEIKASTGGAMGSGSGGVPLIAQWNKDWAETCCGPNPSPPCKKTIVQAGCGLTSYAMVLKYYFPSQNITPPTIARLTSSYCSIDKINTSKLSEVAGPVSITNPRVNELNKIQKLLSEGKPVIINCRPCVGYNPAGALSTRKYGGHLMVLTGYNNGTFTVNDPGADNDLRIASMTTEMITNPCKFVDPNETSTNLNKSALATCNKKTAGQKVNTNPGFWYLRPVGK